MRRPALIAFAALAALLVTPHAARAEGFEWLRSKNRDVERGNEKLAAGDANGALEAYDRAARELPGEGGVHLNRGLALLKQGKLDQAREALKLATEPPASSELRSDAYYDLGVAFYRQAEAQLAEQHEEEAQKAFREATDSFRKSAIMKPGRKDAAWNYELAQRRVVELKQKEEQRKQQEQQQQDEQQKQDEKQDGEPQDSEQPGDPQQQGDEKQDDQGGEEPGKPGEEPKPEPEPHAGAGEEKKDEAKSDEGKQAQAPQPKPEPQKAQEAQAAEAKPDENGPKPLPADVARALDALQSGEKNLEQQRAAQRAGQRRPPAKDW